MEGFTMSVFLTSAENFIQRAKWLTEDDEVMVVALKETAAELDAAGVQASLLNQYRLIFKALQKPVEGAEESDDDAFLDGL